MQTRLPFLAIALGVIFLASFANAQSNWPTDVLPKAAIAPAADASTPQQPSSANQDAVREIQELKQRLDRCEAVLRTRDAELPGANVVSPASYAPTPPSAALLNAGLATKSDDSSKDDKPKRDAKSFGDLKPEPLVTSPTIKIGGKAILDNAWFSQDNANRALVGDEQDYTGFRFLRLMFYGDLYENINYRMEIDMAQAQSSTNPGLLAAFQDVWVNFRELPILGHLKIGFFKEPYGLEQQTGEEYLLFMERSLANTFAPARRFGAMAYDDLNEDKTLSWFTGVFREGSGNKTFLEYSDNGDYGTTSRLVWLPTYDTPSGGRYLTHLGAAYEYTGANNNNTDTKVFSLIPEVNSQIPFSAVTVNCHDYQLFGAEAAWMHGPLLVKSEYMSAFLPQTNGREATFDGGYVEVLYVLTGENHNYNMAGKFFQGVTPYEPFFRIRSTDGDICTGWGAWELGARASYLDLNSGGIAGGRAVDYTVGLHWYLTNNCSAMFNYIHSDFDKGPADTAADILGTRLEFHF